MTEIMSVKDQAWFKKPSLRRIFDLLNIDGEEVRVAGGAVRNSLMGHPIEDIDLATTWLPNEVTKLAAKAGIKVVHTGIEHGTVTLVADGAAFEVTTLREDIETDGRHAKVLFGKNWQKDAERRDLTINGLYANADGEIIDLVGGIDDIKSANIRFIGEADKRIKEDYLRVLRFFRFFARYGAGRPDAEGLKASVRAVSKLSTLSVERIWKEMVLLLSADDPSRSLLWMRTTGVLTALFPETEKWGIDAVTPLVETKKALGWDSDPLLLLESMVPPDPERIAEMAKRLKMSNLHKDRLLEWVSTPMISHEMADIALDRMLYRGSVSGIKDVLRLSLVNARSRAHGDDKAMMEAANYTRLLKRLENWQKPEFPIAGKDLIAAGVEKGKAIGEKLAELEYIWIESDFQMSRDQLLSKI